MLEVFGRAKIVRCLHPKCLLERRARKARHVPSDDGDWHEQGEIEPWTATHDVVDMAPGEGDECSPEQEQHREMEARRYVLRREKRCVVEERPGSARVECAETEQQAE